jgi:hypothetical protein
LKKRLKPSLALTLIGLALLLSAPSNVGSNKKHQDETGHNSSRTSRQKQSSAPSGMPTIIIEPSGPAQEAEHRATAEKTNAPQKWWQRPSATDWGILVVTFVYTFASIALLVATKRASDAAVETLKVVGRQADTAERQLAIANRAYLYLSGVSLMRIPQSPEANVEITYPIYNGGPTPAIFIGDYSRLMVARRVSEIGKVENAATRKQSVVIPPRGGEPMNAKHWTFLTDDELEQVEKGERQLLFYGFLMYFDVFNIWHKTWFALTYSGPLEAGQKRFMGFVTEPEYNRFD